MCFVSNQSDLNFPTMRAVPGMQDDFSGLILALMELTQMLSSAHDILVSGQDASNVSADSEAVPEQRPHNSIGKSRRVLQM